MKNINEMGFQELAFDELMFVDGGGERWDAFCDACADVWAAVKDAASSFYDGFVEGFNRTNVMNY